MTVLRPGTNDWVCIPGDQNVLGWPDMAVDPTGMVWFKDLLARKPKPTNTCPNALQVIVTDTLASEKHRTATQWMDFEVVK